MKNESKIIAGIIFATAVITALFITLGILYSPVKSKREIWQLKTLENNIALYKNEELIEIFDDIYLDVLPAADREELKNGIAFETRSDAVRATEDYN